MSVSLVCTMVLRPWTSLAYFSTSLASFIVLQKNFAGKYTNFSKSPAYLSIMTSLIGLPALSINFHDDSISYTEGFFSMPQLIGRYAFPTHSNHGRVRISSSKHSCNLMLIISWYLSLRDFFLLSGVAVSRMCILPWGFPCSLSIKYSFNAFQILPIVSWPSSLTYIFTIWFNWSKRSGELLNSDFKDAYVDHTTGLSISFALIASNICARAIAALRIHVILYVSSFSS